MCSHIKQNKQRGEGESSLPMIMSHGKIGLLDNFSPFSTQTFQWSLGLHITFMLLTNMKSFSWSWHFSNCPCVSLKEHSYQNNLRSVSGSECRRPGQFMLDWQDWHQPRGARAHSLPYSECLPWLLPHCFIFTYVLPAYFVLHRVYCFCPPTY